MAVRTNTIWSSPPQPDQLRPFRIRAGTRGCLLLHGFAGTPPEMRGLGEYLAAAGYDVMGPLLAGHGLTPEAMALTRWTDWVRSAQDALTALRRDCREVFVAGQSLGGTLALHLAATNPAVTGVVAVGGMGSPDYFRDWRVKGIGAPKDVVRWDLPLGDWGLRHAEPRRLLQR